MMSRNDYINECAMHIQSICNTILIHRGVNATGLVSAIQDIAKEIETTSAAGEEETK